MAGVCSGRRAGHEAITRSDLPCARRLRSERPQRVLMILEQCQGRGEGVPPLGQQFVHDARACGRRVGEGILAPVVAIRQPRVIEAELMQQRRQQVLAAHR